MIFLAIDPPCPVARNYEIIDYLQLTRAPELFNPRASYDGKKNMCKLCYLSV